jgi:hypothetical protein
MEEIGPTVLAAHQAELPLNPIRKNLTLHQRELPDEREDDHEELEKGNGHDDEMDGGGMDLLVNLAGCVHKCQIVPVN